MSWLALVAGAYLLGAVSFSLVVVWLLKGIDLRTVGSGNAGATNVLRTAGTGPALAVLLLDVGKGVAAVAVARALGAPGPVVGAAAAAAVAGHIFPIYHGFRGGKGIATLCGAMGVLAPRPALLAALIFVLVLAATRYVSLASMTGAGLFPILIYLSGRIGWTGPAPPWLLITTALIAILVIAKHSANVRRLIAGSENRFGGPATPHPVAEDPHGGTK